MGCSHQAVADEWARHTAAKGSRMYTDGITVFSYASHWPIATHLSPGRVLLNTSSCSQSTSKHLSHVRRACGRLDVTTCTKSQLVAALESPRVPLVITQFKEASSIKDGLTVLESVYHCTGARRFPRAQIAALLMPGLVAAKL